MFTSPFGQAGPKAAGTFGRPAKPLAVPAAARPSAQGIAEPLNAPARLFELFGRSGIGNPEMSRRSVSRAVNDRHRFGIEQLGGELLVRPPTKRPGR
ncbi:hypothetical protein [Azospirillum endophyticum]